MILPRPNQMPTRKMTNMSVPAVAGSSPRAKFKGGEFICDGGGCGNAGYQAYSFRHQGVSGSDFAAESRPADDFRWRIFRHLRCDVPVPPDIALSQLAIGTRGWVPRAHLHHP